MDANKTDKQSIEVIRTVMVLEKGSWKPLYECLMQPRGKRVWFAQSTHMSGSLHNWYQISDEDAASLISYTMGAIN